MGWNKTVEKVVSKLPINKLTSNQTFDLSFDLVMVLIGAFVLRSSLADDLKVALCMLAMLFSGWSFWINRPIKR